MTEYCILCGGLVPLYMPYDDGYGCCNHCKDGGEEQQRAAYNLRRWALTRFCCDRCEKRELVRTIEALNDMIRSWCWT